MQTIEYVYIDKTENRITGANNGNDYSSLRELNIELKNINLQLSKTNIDLEKYNLSLENKIINLEVHIERLTQLIKANNIENILFNNNSIFGKESLEHITQRTLEKNILEIIELDYEDYKNKFFEINGQRYKKEHIRDIDIHILLTKLIYCSNERNKTIKKEKGIYYIYSDFGWENIEFEYLNERILTKHQEVLAICKQTILDNKIFMRAIKHYYQDDENYNLIIEPTGTENTFLKNYPRNKILKKILDYELDNLDNLDIIDHSNNLI
jgi:hypothetical protein